MFGGDASQTVIVVTRRWPSPARILTETANYRTVRTFLSAKGSIDWREGNFRAFIRITVNKHGLIIVRQSFCRWEAPHCDSPTIHIQFCDERPKQTEAMRLHRCTAVACERPCCASMQRQAWSIQSCILHNANENQSGRRKPRAQVKKLWDICWPPFAIYEQGIANLSRCTRSINAHLADDSTASLASPIVPSTEGRVSLQVG